MNKKSQSTVITGVLLILLAVVAVLILWSIVRNTVDKGGKEILSKSECISLNLDIIGNFSSREIIIRRNSGSGDLSEIKILINGIVTNDGADASGLDEGEEGIFDTLTTFFINDKIKIAPVLEDKTQCNIADEFIVV